jgi:glycerophosphoryl diester phosphodiesterase
MVFGWQLLVQMLGVAAFTPLAGWLLNRVVARTGSAVVSNFDIAAFVLSPWGLVFVLAVTVASVTFHVAQFAGHSWIAGHAITERPVSIWSTIGAVWTRLDLLVPIGLRMLARIALLAVPFLAMVALLWWTTLRGHDINYYLAERPPAWRRVVLVAGVCGAAYGFLALRQFAYWIYSMPLAMFDERATADGVLATSTQMLKGRLWRTITPLLLWWIGLAVIATSLFWLGRQFTVPALDWAGLDVRRVLPLVALFLAVSVSFGFVYATLQFAGHQFLITRLYAEQHSGGIAVSPEADEEAEARGRGEGRAVVFALTGVLLLALGIAGVMLAKMGLHDDIAVTAHRGASLRAPENTLAAFREAAEAGADYVELDVQRTRDGHIVVIHDGDLMRLAGDPRKVRDLTLAELQALDVGSRRGAAYAGERVPTLEEVIGFARGRLLLNVELKYNVPDAELAPAVVDMLSRERFDSDSVITSLDLGALRQVEQQSPGMVTGLIVTAAVGSVAHAETDFLSLNAAKAKASLVRRLHGAGKAVHVWTVNDPEAMLRMIERGVDNVITDDPARLVGLLQERSALSTPERLGLTLRALFTRMPPELVDEAAVTPL